MLPAELAMLDMVLGAESLRNNLCCVGRRYRALFAWLLATLRRAEVEVRDVGAALPRSLVHLAAEFINQDLDGDVIGHDLEVGLHPCRPL